MSYIAQAIHELKPGAEFSFINDDYSTIVWDVLDGTAPTQKQIEDKITEIKTREANVENIRLSARSKLMSGQPLTQAEAECLIP